MIMRSIVRALSLGALPAIIACSASNSIAPSAESCESPAPVKNTPDPRSPEIFVSFKPGVDGSAAIARLQARLNFTILWEPVAQTGFLATLTNSQIASIRCDTAVAFVEWNSVGTGDDPG